MREITLVSYDRLTRDRHVITDHPPIPDVLDVLCTRCMDLTYRAGEPIRWWPYDVAWAAVNDLHWVGRHNDAAELAKFLRWCDSQGDVMWELIIGSTTEEDSGSVSAPREADTEEAGQ